MAITKDEISEQYVKFDHTASTINQKSSQLIEYKTSPIRELEAENIRLREEIEKRKKSEAVLEAFFNYTFSSVVILDRNYNYIRVNEAFAKACSRDVSDYPGHNHFEFYPSDHKEIFDNVVKTKKIYKASASPFTFFDHSEWEFTYWDWTLAPVLDSSGEVDLLIFTLNNITENVGTKEKLVKSKERYRTIFDTCLDGILLTNKDNIILSANPSACYLLGRTGEELCGVGMNEVVDLNSKVKSINKEIEKTGSYKGELIFKRKDGTKFPAEVTSNLYGGYKGNILYSVFIRDIIERKKVEEALRLSEEKFHKAFHNNQTMMAFLKFKDGVYIDVNSSYAEVLGYTREEIIGKSVFELGIWADEEERQDVRKQLAQNGYARNCELKYRSKSGEISYVVATTNLLDIGGEKCILGSFIDITEQKRAEEALRKSEELFYLTFNANPLPMCIISTENETFMEINEALSKSSGYLREEIIGCSINDINGWLNLGEREKFREAIDKNGFVTNHETSLLTKSGEIATALMSGVSIMWNNEECYLVIHNDITELRSYQQEMARLDRLNLVGEMSAGIGHEIRNPMTIVRGFLQLLRGKDRYAQDKENMDLMIEELDRANSIITEFLSLAKDKAVEKKSQSLNKQIRTILPLLQADALKQDKNIEIELGDIPHIIIDKNEVIQLLINLVRNGLESMSPGGLLSIKTFKDDDEVVLAVQDRGTGITPEILEKIGTPFFTTKDNGTGLGLAVCYSIAQRHNAKIDIETGSTGTTFYVRFNT